MCNCEDRPCCGCGDNQGLSLFGVEASEYRGEMLRPCTICGEVDCEGECDHGPESERDFEPEDQHLDNMGD